MTGALSPSGGERGFTLLELLVAVALMAFIVLGLASALRTGAKAWDAGDAAAERTNEMRLVHDTMRRYFSAGVPLFFQKDGKWTLRFYGDARQIRFVAELMPPYGTGGLYEMVFELAESNPRDLRLSSALLHTDADEILTTEFASATLVEGPSELVFDYFGTDDAAPPSWHARWENKNTLPRLVRMRLVTGSGEEWPALVMRPHSTARRLLATESVLAPQSTATPGP